MSVPMANQLYLLRREPQLRLVPDITIAGIFGNEHLSLNDVFVMAQAQEGKMVAAEVGGSQVRALPGSFIITNLQAAFGCFPIVYAFIYPNLKIRDASKPKYLLLRSARVDRISSSLPDSQQPRKQ
jgi:hypothetical protein